MTISSMSEFNEDNAFQKAIKLKNEASNILRESLERAYPFSGAADGDKDAFCVPVVGIRPNSRQNYQLAIHIAAESDKKLIAPIFNHIPAENIDIQVTGPVIPYGSQVCFGAAISHCDPIASQQSVGTLGCFVKKPGQSDIYMLSNNHVIANLNKGQRGKDTIFLHEIIVQEEYQLNSQPVSQDSIFVKNKKLLQQFLASLFPKWVTSPYSEPVTITKEKSNNINEIGTLIDFIELKAHSTNLVDAAIATINDLSLVTLDDIPEVGRLKGYHHKENIKELSQDLKFTKIGRKTGQTWGKLALMSADLSLNYNDDLTGCQFPDILAFEGLTQQAFSQRGDSGSLIIDENGYALALLIAGTLKGGSNNKGITYGIPISTVLKVMNIDLVIDEGIPQIC